ncbi:MAG TPA: aminopeptidase P family protein [bacterium]|nr:aminopeptidase P family protein [bacterium]
MNYAGRIRSLQKSLKKNRFFYAAGHSDIFYLSGFSGTFARILVSADKAVFITDPRYEGALNRSCVPHLFETVITRSLKKDLLPLAGRKNRILISVSTPLNDYLLLSENNTKPEISSLLSLLRSVKDADEIALIKKASLIAGLASQHTASILKRGITEDEAAFEYEKYARQHGAESLSFAPIVAFGANSAVPHHATGSTRLKKGDLVLIDAGVKYRGYCSDLTRVYAFCIIHPRLKELRKIFNYVKNAKKNAAKTLKNGVLAEKPGKAAGEYLKSNGGLDIYFTHSIGHGLGIDVHEEPFLGRSGSIVLKTGNVVTIEPGVYFPGKYGIRTEDDYLIGRAGCVKLSRAEDSLAEIG